MRSLWMDPEERSFAALEEDIEVDVAVVGAGFSGLGAAWGLRDRGLRVVVLESRTVASGASGRNAGFVLAGPAMPFDRAVAALGLEAAYAIWQYTRTNHWLLAGLIEEFGIECGYLRRGSMSLAASDEERDSLTLTHDALTAAGIPSALVEQIDIPRPFDGLYLGGIYYPGNGELDPGRFLRGLATLLPASMLYEATPVLSVESESERSRLTTPGGVILADTVLLATNAYTTALFPAAPIAPARGQVLATEPLDRVVVPFPMYANEGFQYWRQTAEGAIVAGGWRDLDPSGETGTDEILHRDIQRALTEFVEDTAGAPPVVAHRWAGIMGFTPDHFPLAGPAPGHEGMWIAAGYSGHGVAMAFNTGRQAALGLIGAQHDLPASFDPARFDARGA